MNSVNLLVNRDPDLVRDLISEQGFALIDLGINKESISVMKITLMELINQDLLEWGQNPHYRDHWMVMNLMFRNSIFLDLLDNEIISQCVSSHLGSSHILYSFTSSSMPPSGSNFSRRVHVDQARFIENYPTNMGLVIALDEFTVNNGATQILPYSHLKDQKPDEKYFEDNHVKVQAKPGQGLLFHGRLWHAGGANITDKPRHALTLNFCRSFMRQHFDFTSMYESLQPQPILGENAYRLLGMNVRMPKSLEDYYVPENLRLYKPNQG